MRESEETHLNNLSFLEAVNWIREASERISYSKGSSTAHRDSSDLIRYLINRNSKESKITPSLDNKGIKDSLESTYIRLNDYFKFPKLKADTIAKFKSDIEEDTRWIIHQIENAEK